MPKLSWLGWSKPGPVARAPRVHAEVPVLYRELGGFGWQSGKTRDISRTGILFRVPRSVEVGTPVELSFTPPEGVLSEVGNVVACRGKVVRRISSVDPANTPLVAAKITHWDEGRRRSDW